MSEFSDVSLTDMLDCARRELKMRERVYPRWVEAKRMSPQQATRETRVMKAIVALLEERAAEARLL